MGDSEMRYLRTKIIIASVYLLLSANIYAIPATLNTTFCGLSSTDTSNASLFAPVAAASLPNLFLTNTAAQTLLTGFRNPNPNVNDILVCQYSSLPSLIDTTCDVTATEVDGQTNYVAAIFEATPGSATYCLYQYDLDLSAADTRTNGAVALAAAAISNPAAVPIFTPLGFLIAIFGFLWFGRRKTKQ